MQNYLAGLAACIATCTTAFKILFVELMELFEIDGTLALSLAK